MLQISQLVYLHDVAQEDGDTSIADGISAVMRSSNMGFVLVAQNEKGPARNKTWKVLPYLCV